eukprot:5094670-Pleurochrysis_carterae.AAC.1
MRIHLKAFSVQSQNLANGHQTAIELLDVSNHLRVFPVLLDQVVQDLRKLVPDAPRLRAQPQPRSGVP